MFNDFRMMEEKEKKACEEEIAGIQLGREYGSGAHIATDEEIKESVELINPDDGTKDRG